MEEHSDVDEADLHEEIEDDSEDVEDYSDETESDLEHGSEAQFSQAVNTIRTRSESFKYPEALYEFLYKYRDILEYSSPVSGTLLHSIASTTPEEYSDVAALAQRLIQEHPQLLCETDGERLTPLSMALVEARRHFIVTILRICSDDPNCSRALGEALQVGDRHGRTALHHLSRNPSRFKASLIVKVLSFATDGALALKDEEGRTPLYHVIKSERWRRSTIEVIKYFLARDAAAQEMSRSRELSSESIHTFLDVIDDHGLSAYEFLVPFEKNQRDRPKMKPPGPERNNDAEKPESMRPVTDRTSDQVANISLVREYRQRLTGEVSTAVTESKICSEIAELLKLHYIRTRDIAKASRFLYGDNAEDIQLYFNYTGGPAEVKMPQFEAAFHATKFCDTLKFVAFPSSVSVVKDSSLASNISAKRAAGFGRRDMEFFAKWLQRKGVKHIMSMQVYDFNPCHSDESIGAVLQRFQIEYLDWRKIDLDPRTVQKACNEVRSLILWWSGNNTTLRAWSEPTGLPALPYLKRIRICLPREIQAADSMACVENNIAEFRKRLQGSLDAETGDIKSANHDAINASVEGNDEKGSLSASASKSRSIQVQFSASRALSTGLGEPVSDKQDIAVSRQWLRHVHEFSRSFSDVWKEFPTMNRGWIHEADGPVVVALIDDGVDILDPSLPPGAVNSGASFEVDASHRIRPWYTSHSGHGTMVASLINWVCPMAQLYSIRVGPTEGNEVDLRSLATALRSAIARATIIVLGRYTIFSYHNSSEVDREEMSQAIDLARRKGKIILQPLPESSSFGSFGDSGVGEPFWGIIPAQDERTHVPDVLERNLDFYSLVIPGTNAIVSHLSENNGGEFAGLLGVLSRVDEDESSVATALAAGIISILICCYKLIASSKELEYGSVAYKEAQRNLSYVMQPAGMKTVIKNLGDLTEDRVVQVWQRLDPVSCVLGDKYQSLEEKIDQLVTLTRQLALGLRDRGSESP